MMARIRALTGGLELYLLSLLGVLALAPLIVLFAFGFGLGVIFVLPAPLVAARQLTRLVRRRTLALTGMEIQEPYAPEPPPPVPQSDGWYVRDRKLYKRAWWPRFADQFDWVLGDHATWRDLTWMLLAPVAGLAGIAVVPLAALVLFLAPAGWLMVALLAVAVMAGLAVAPVGLAFTARFHRRFLGGPLFRSNVDEIRSTHRFRGRMAKAFLPVVQLAVLFGTSILAVPVFALTLLGFLATYGLGMVFALPWVLEDLRWLADWRRKLAVWSGVSIASPYRPLPPLVPRADGLYKVHRSLYRTVRWAAWAQRWRWLQADPATWREILWRGTDPVVGGLLAGLPVLMAAYGIWGLFIPRIVQLFTDQSPRGPWYGNFAGQASLAVPVAVLLVAAAVAIAPRALRAHGQWTKLLLGPAGDAVLAQRVEQLTLSRADASDAAARELRRIERDLHDGTQARLVALGLGLAAIERLIDTDPLRAKELAVKTRESAALALTELRQVVRGIHPPVLHERGLGDAVRALALDSPVPADVTVDLPVRPPDPIEAAAYFAVAEALGNVAKHARARHVWIQVTLADEVLRLVVRDDGRGGADPERGSGLRGLARRLGIFDGTVSVSSPNGGPTELTMEIPCASSSPRTFSSSGKD